MCYYLDDHSKFEEYLYRRTYFETGSAKRHHFAEIYREGDGLYFKLNVTIRMKEQSAETMKTKGVQKKLI